MSESLLSFDTEGVQFAWDATSLSNYAKCPRYYQLVNLEGWAPDLTSVHLDFGGWYASALESYYKLRADGTSPDDSIREVINTALFETWEFEEDPETGEPIPGSGQPWDRFHNAKTRFTLIRSIVWYLEKFGENDNTTIIHLDNGKPAAELSFSLELSSDVVYCGHMDRMVEYGGDGDKYVMDQKTSGSTITPKFFEGFSLDFQMSGYSYAGRVLYNTPVKGVIIDAAQIAVGFTEFTRGFTYRTDAVLDFWAQNTLEIIRRAQRDIAENKFPLNYSSCDKYGGCQFRDVCKRSPEFWENGLRAKFTQRPRWDPLKRR